MRNRLSTQTMMTKMELTRTTAAMAAFFSISLPLGYTPRAPPTSHTICGTQSVPSAGEEWGMLAFGHCSSSHATVQAKGLP